MASGYLVVLRSVGLTRSLNPRYLGIDRLPPWNQAAYDAGYDDPYVFGDLVDERGLIRAFEDAAEAKQIIGRVCLPDELGTIFVTNDQSKAPDGFEFAGYDVAEDGSPFESSLRDVVPDPGLRCLLVRLNDNGLFSEYRDATEFARRRVTVDAPDPPYALTVWQVFLARSQFESQATTNS